MRRLAPLLALLLASVLAACGSEPTAELPAPAEEPPAPPPPPAQEPPRELSVRSGTFKRNETIVAALGRVDVDVNTAHAIVAALDGIFDFRKARPDDQFRVTRENGELALFELRRGPVEEYLVYPENGKLVGVAREFEIETEVVHVSATLETSLYEALLAAGEDPSLAVEMSEVLAWDIDFYNDPRKGDTFDIVVEKRSYAGRRVGYGALLAAAYDGQLVGRKRVFRYRNPKNGQYEYYAEDGSAARRAFLKSPLKFANITSRYGSRFHPVLKYVKQHQGVDYGAPVGTPVWAVGDGTVTRAGWAGACGKMVALRHANGLESIYCHLSRIGEGIRVGKRVAQKQVIGYVGATGRVTGPHLHYAVKRHGSFVNPLALKFPPAEPLPADQLPAFRAEIDPWLLLLDGRAAFATAEDEPRLAPQ